MLRNKIKSNEVFNLLGIIWRSKKSIMISCAISILVAVGVGFSIPKTYQSTVILAPESSKSISLGSLSSFASLAGLDVGGVKTEDAIYPELYPQIVSSTSFMEELYAMEVVSQDGQIRTTLYEYISAYQDKAWWDYILEFPMVVKSWFTTKEKTAASASGEAVETSYKVYSEAQNSILNKMKKLIQCTVDVGNDVITINVEMQDPYIAAQVASEVADLLQKKVTKYRTEKYVTDYEYTNKLYEESRDTYYKKQQEYAEYLDRHALGTTMARYRTDGDRLEDEMTLAYTIYCQLAQQKELAKAKVQEKTPVFTVLQPAVVPTIAFSPSKMFILVSFLFLTFFGHVVWLIYRKKVKAAFDKAKEGE